MSCIALGRLNNGSDPLALAVVDYALTERKRMSDPARAEAIVRHLEALIESHITSGFYNPIKDTFLRSTEAPAYLFCKDDLCNYDPWQSPIQVSGWNWESYKGRTFWAAAAHAGATDGNRQLVERPLQRRAMRP